MFHMLIAGLCDLSAFALVGIYIGMLADDFPRIGR
jgi:hypothetical protein